jgi:hypothetical protein
MTPDQQPPINLDIVHQLGVPVANEQLWKAFHNCSYRRNLVMQSMLLQGGSKSLIHQSFQRT